MSGITGYINHTKKPSDDLLDRMSRSIRYVESDCIDKWEDDFISLCLVTHTFTNKNPGTQHIFNKDKSVFIMMLGEVYDYEEQKNELINKDHEFQFEDNDAEFCLHLYEEMGEKAFKKLNGTFCLAIYHVSTHDLLLVNDRFSSYSLYYHVSDRGTLIFSTQASSILQSKEIPRELNMEAVFEFFALQRVLGTKTYYKGIRYLPPATFLRYKANTISFDTYWERRYKEEKHPETYYVNKLAETLKKAVKRRTQRNYRYGILLSGGMDSRAILASAEKNIVCFTVGDFENREIKTARRIAGTRGSKHIILKRDIDHYVKLVDQSVSIGDGMYCFEHAHFIGFFDQFRKECDVLLHGNVPELFFRGANLPRKKNVFSIKFTCKLSDDTLEETFLLNKKYSVYKKNPEILFNEPHASMFKKTVAYSLKNIFVGVDKKVENISDKYLWPDTYYTSRYPSFLNDMHLRAFMNPCSAVLFDNDLLDLHLRMPPDMKSNSRVWNKALAQLNPEIAAIPDANTGLSPGVNQFLGWMITRYKRTTEKLNRFLRPNLAAHPSYVQGSWPNFARLIRHNQKMKKLISKTIKDPECLNPDIFNIRKIEGIFRDHMNGKSNHKFFLLLLLTFGTWYKKYGPKANHIL